MSDTVKLTCTENHAIQPAALRYVEALAARIKELEEQLLASESQPWRRRISELEAENARLAGILDGVELIAVNDKTGCRSCTAVVNAIVTEQPNRAVYERAHAAEQRAARAEAELREAEGLLRECGKRSTMTTSLHGLIDAFLARPRTLTSP